MQFNRWKVKIGVKLAFIAGGYNAEEEEEEEVEENETFKTDRCNCWIIHGHRQLHHHDPCGNLRVSTTPQLDTGRGRKKWNYVFHLNEISLTAHHIVHIKAAILQILQIDFHTSAIPSSVAPVQHFISNSHWLYISLHWIRWVHCRATLFAVQHRCHMHPGLPVFDLESLSPRVMSIQIQYSILAN